MAIDKMAKVDMVLSVRLMQPTFSEREVGRVRVSVGKPEYGQGVCDGMLAVAERLPVALADMLGVPVSAVRAFVLPDLTSLGID